jgi:arsenate reductase
MGEAWTRQLKGDLIEPYSAGVNPHAIDPRAVKAMAEVGIDISGSHSKSPEDLDVELDFVITVCDNAHQTCPVFHAKTRVVHVGFDDPPKLAEGIEEEEEAMTHYRRVRDEIKAFVETLPDALTSIGDS